VTNDRVVGRAKRRGRRGGGTVRRTGKSWQARWIEDGERRTQGGFGSKDEAAQFLKRRSDAVVVAAGLADLGLPVPVSRPKGPARAIGLLADEWFEVRKAEGIRMVHEDRWRWDRHLAPILSRRTPDSVEPKDLHRWVSALRNPDPASRNSDGTRVDAISGPTAERVVHLLSAFYRWAIREGHATRNPCRGIARDAGMAKMLRSTHSPDSTVVLQSRADVERLYRAIPLHYVSKVRQSRKKAPKGTKPQIKAAPASTRAPVLNPVPIAYLISALAGLRPGEVVPLEWADVDVERRVIHVRRNYRNGQMSLPKSGKGREVPIVPYLLNELRAWRNKNPGAVLVCPFDNLVWDRAFLERIFGFTHVIEVYKPEPQRVYGYYVLPFLYRDRLVGRADLKSDRGDGVLRVRAFHFEPGVRRSGALETALEKALDRLARVLGLERVARSAS